MIIDERLQFIESNKLYFFIPLSVFVFLSIGQLFTYPLFSDEAWYASTSIDFIQHGTFGNKILYTLCPVQGECVTFEKLDQLTYWQPPVYFLLLIPFLKVFGIGFLQIRLFSFLCGLVVFIGFSTIFKEFFTEQKWAFLASLVLSTSIPLLWSSAVGRMDIVAICLFIIGLTIYIKLRESSFTFSLLLSNLFIALSGLTHPNGIIGFFVLAYTIYYFDYGRISKKNLIIGLFPYFSLGTIYLLYILIDYKEFISQFLFNATKDTSIYTYFIHEIYFRYLIGYNIVINGSGTVSQIEFEQFHRAAIVRICLLLWYGLSIFILHFSKKTIREKWFFHCLLIIIFGFAVICPHKTAYYLSWIDPFFIGVSILAGQKICNNRFRKIAFIFIIIIFCISSVALQVSRITNNTLDDQIHDIEHFVEKIYDGDSLVYGSGEFSFWMDFGGENFIDDAQLGYFTKKLPKYYIVDPRYSDMINQWKNYNTKIYVYIDNSLKNDYRLIYKGEYYKIYSQK